MTIECYYDSCKHHEIHDGTTDVGPFCHREDSAGVPECILQFHPYTTTLKQIFSIRRRQISSGTIALPEKYGRIAASEVWGKLGSSSHDKLGNITQSIGEELVKDAWTKALTSKLTEYL